MDRELWNHLGVYPVDQKLIINLNIFSVFKLIFVIHLIIVYFIFYYYFKIVYFLVINFHSLLNSNLFDLGFLNSNLNNINDENDRNDNNSYHINLPDLIVQFKNDLNSFIINLFYFKNYKINYKFWYHFLDLFQYLINIKLNFFITGDTIDLDNNSIILSNHKSLLDYLIFPYLSNYFIKLYNKNNKNGKDKEDSKIFINLNFLTWALIWQFPSLKLFLNLFNLNENWLLNNDDLTYLFEKKNLLQSFSNHTHDDEKNTNTNKNKNKNININWLILYPEVNIFTLKNLKIQNNNSVTYKFLSNLLYPRFSFLYPFFNYLDDLNINNKKFINLNDFNSFNNYNRIYDISIIYYIIGNNNHSHNHNHNHDGENDLNFNFNPPTILQLLLSNNIKSLNIRININSIQYPKLRHLKKKKNFEKWFESYWFKKDKSINLIMKNIINTNVINKKHSKSKQNKVK
ncbi:Mum3p ASCRUDRAFT_8338 [Ascoidea rubescens DSM 1968]|uniref:Uncharacterized protein n=1 Tax=Ascoidea rubescens DSM 1968 TaxID=1344418 RepID=A0A1D2VGE8_9ASCO|nr:hypothetical protein ASCRUDRAFT_8338 [Ascoidea rubescens DSM 1968]ODV60738.1 hypothetical protein ASCRUDRAFT_8338 [Ascoidea rubescens DSM 1968]